MSGVGGKTRTSGQGRPPGIPNRVTSDIREMLRASLDQAGGVAYLVRQADENPSSYMALIGKIVPQQIDATIKHDVAELTREQLLTMLASVRAIAQPGPVIEHERGDGIRPQARISAPKKGKV